MDKKQQASSNYNYQLQLGMTFKEVEKYKGSPDLIDEINKNNQYFQMWTYINNSEILRLYFDGSKLIRIQE